MSNLVLAKRMSYTTLKPFIWPTLATVLLILFVLLAIEASAHPSFVQELETSDGLSIVLSKFSHR